MPQVKGEFHVELSPLESVVASQSSVVPGRMAIKKTYYGELQGTAVGEMLSCRTPVNGSAGYVALEWIQATVQGLSGSFVVQHFGMMSRGEQRQLLEIVADSGTDELAGIKGQMRIEIDNGKHYYHFNYTLPAE